MTMSVLVTNNITGSWFTLDKGTYKLTYFYLFYHDIFALLWLESLSVTVTDTDFAGLYKRHITTLHTL